MILVIGLLAGTCLVCGGAEAQVDQVGVGQVGTSSSEKGDAAAQIAARAPDCGAADADCTTVELLVPQSYERLTSAGLTALLKGLPSRIVQFPRGSTISGLVARNFAFIPGRIRTPFEFQDRVLDWVRSANGVLDDRAVQAGKLLVPTLPSATEATATETTAMPARAPSLVYDAASKLLGLSGNPVSQRRGSVSVMRLHVPRSEAANILANSALRGFLPALVDEPGRSNTAIELNFAGEASVNGEAVDLGYLTSAQVQALQERLKRRATMSTRVVVIDSGWPDEASRTAAWTRLADLSGMVERLSGVRIAVPAAPTNPFVAATNPHASAIAATITALASLAPDPAHPVVAVDYVPLTREQGAEPWLRTMLALAVVARDWSSRRDDFARMSDRELRARGRYAWSEADTTLRLVPAQFGSSTRVRSSSAIIDRAMFLTRFAVEDGEVSERYFINTSWTAPKDSLAVAVPLGDGLLVAALGNDAVPALETAGGLDFGRLSYSDPHVVAVANFSADGRPLCNTNTIVAEKLRGSTMVAFDGAVGRTAAVVGLPSGSVTCGTSFAAPRVAWLLAAVEATRSAPPSGASWIPEIAAALRFARFGDDKPSPGWLDVTALMNARP